MRGPFRSAVASSFSMSRPGFLYWGCPAWPSPCGVLSWVVFVCVPCQDLQVWPPTLLVPSTIHFLPPALLYLANCAPFPAIVHGTPALLPLSHMRLPCGLGAAAYKTEGSLGLSLRYSCISPDYDSRSCQMIYPPSK